MRRLLITVMLFAAALGMPIQADFIQCTAALGCFGSDNDDVINGLPSADDIIAMGGNDIIFGGDGSDDIDGQLGNDIIFGGRNSDLLKGQEGDDTLIPGPDDVLTPQNTLGDAGNDTFIVLVGETVYCQHISGGPDFDVLHLIGFGPYVAEFPYGATPPIATGSNIVIQDPIAGGYIFVTISDQDPDNLERINGLATPNLAVLDPAAARIFFSQNCIFSENP